MRKLINIMSKDIRLSKELTTVVSLTLVMGAIVMPISQYTLDYILIASMTTGFTALLLSLNNNDKNFNIRG